MNLLIANRYGKALALASTFELDDGPKDSLAWIRRLFRH
jgi:hypothetical protein